jgi:hypothetical protein
VVKRRGAPRVQRISVLLLVGLHKGLGIFDPN